MSLPYAEDVNYWKTGRSAPDMWLDDTCEQIKKCGGKVIGHAFMTDGEGSSSYFLAFEIEGQRYKITWPVLESKSGNDRAARIQATTFLYHDIKARVLSATILGFRIAFLPYMLMPNNLTPNEMTNEEIVLVMPKLLTEG